MDPEEKTTNDVTLINDFAINNNNNNNIYNKDFY